MGVTMAVPDWALESAREEWDEQADRLDAAARRLFLASASPVCAAISRALTDFRVTWVDQIKDAATAAHDHSASLGAFGDDTSFVDRAEAESVRALLPWTYHDTPITAEASS